MLGYTTTLGQHSHTGTTQPHWDNTATLGQHSHTGITQPHWDNTATLGQHSHTGTKATRDNTAILDNSHTGQKPHGTKATRDKSHTGQKPHETTATLGLGQHSHIIQPHGTTQPHNTATQGNDYWDWDNTATLLLLVRLLCKRTGTVGQQPHRGDSHTGSVGLLTY
jgi:hypothetical protein